MDYIFLGNSLARWGAGMGVALLLLVAFCAARRLVTARLAPLARHSATLHDDFALRLLSATSLPLVAVAAAYLVGLVLALSPRYELVLGRLALIAVLLQIAIWADTGVRTWRTIYHQREAAQGGEGAPSMTLMCFMMRMALWIVVGLMVLDNMGVNITTLVASLGIGGIAVALAVQNILGDLFASLSIMLDKPFVRGDFIIVGDALGTVEFVGLKTTRLRALSGEQIIFSNADLLKSRIHNHQRMAMRRAAFIIRVSYQASEAQLRAIPGMLRECVQEQENTLFERAHFTGYTDSSLDFETVYHVKTADYVVFMDTQQAINFKLFSRFRAAGIAFAHPTRVVQLAGEAEPESRRAGPVPFQRPAGVHQGH
jgi:small-conductance mechanosensitive channel